MAKPKKPNPKAGEGPAYPGSSAGHPRTAAAGEGPAYPGSSAGHPRIGTVQRPTHGVGGGVVSRKPAARGGRSSVILGAPPIGASPLASYLKRKPGKRVK